VGLLERLSGTSEIVEEETREPEPGERNRDNEVVGYRPSDVTHSTRVLAHVGSEHE
jgi:hypothetical protein